MTTRSSEAARWLALRANGGRLSAEEARRFERWLADPGNRDEYARMERLYREAGEADLFSDEEVWQTLRATAADAARRRASLATWTGWGRLLAANCGAFVAMAAVLALGVFLWLGRAPAPEFARFETGRGEQRTVSLSDGSEVTLDGATRFEAVFTADERRLREFDGRAVFRVHGDAARPFVIEAGAARVEVVGTEFQVDRRREGATVTVAEGVVKFGAVEAAGGGAVLLRMGEGARLAATGGAVERIEFPLESFASWRGGRIVFAALPLQEVVREADRYFDGDIIIRGEELRRLAVSGSFQTDQPVDFLLSLELILPVTVDRIGDRLIEIGPKR
ncbi:MAG: FecR domain-containing protein [Verrucomicrobiota bacterium]